MRLGFLLLAVALIVAGAGQSWAREIVKVGYREDARPFVYKVNTAEGESFEGFIAELCDMALAEAGYEVEKIAVDAESRWSALDNSEVDMLCDTTSITMARADERLFSPMIFLSGVSYAYSARAEQNFLAAYPKAPQDFGAEGKALGAAPFCSDQAEDLTPRLPADRQPLLRVGVLNATTADSAVRNSETLKLFRLKPGEKICIESVVGNYAQGIDRLCKGQFAFFFGDRDMLQAYLGEELAQSPDCDAILSGKFFSYEPYGLVVRSDRIDLALKLQKAIFTLFSKGTIDDLFDTHFNKRSKSDLLNALFRINAIGKVE